MVGRGDVCGMGTHIHAQSGTEVRKQTNKPGTTTQTSSPPPAANARHPGPVFLLHRTLSPLSRATSSCSTCSKVGLALCTQEKGRGAL